MSNVGIYSGTFDPVHVGHVAFALESIEQGHVDKVEFLLERVPREKSLPTAYKHRLNMLSLATNEYPLLHVLPLEAPQFTVQETLPQLQALFPDDELVFIVGSDLVKTFSYRWPGLEAFLQAVPLVIGLRGTDTAESIQALLTNCEKATGVTIRSTILASPHAQLASTHIRRGDHDIQDIHPDVAGYIQATELYL